MTDDEVRVAQHLHCPVCGKAIPPEEDVCSDECSDKMKVYAKKKKSITYLYMAMALIVLFLLVFAPGA